MYQGPCVALLGPDCKAPTVCPASASRCSMGPVLHGLEQTARLQWRVLPMHPDVAWVLLCGFRSKMQGSDGASCRCIPLDYRWFSAEPGAGCKARIALLPERYDPRQAPLCRIRSRTQTFDGALSWCILMYHRPFFAIPKQTARICSGSPCRCILE